MKKAYFLVYLLFAGMVLTGCSTINTRSQEVYTVATGLNFAPFAYLNEETGEVDGFDVDLMKAIAKEGNFAINFEPVDWDGFIAAIQKGRYDLGIYGVTITEERKTKVDFSAPYYSAGLIIMVQAENNEIKSEKDLAGKKVGTVIGTTSEHYLRTNFPESEIVSFLRSPELYLEIHSGRIDAVLYDAPSIKYYITKKAVDELKTVGDNLQGEEYGILFPKESPLLQRVDKALRELIEKGIYDDIYENWFSERPYGTK